MQTEVFRFITAADPEQVWSRLTETGRPLAHFNGMTVHGDWQAGSTITMGFCEQLSLMGEVLVADRPRCLSHTLRDCPAQPAVYVTWEIRTLEQQTVVRLIIDEPDPTSGTTEDLELGWLPVLAALQRDLDERFPTVTQPEVT